MRTLHFFGSCLQLLWVMNYVAVVPQATPFIDLFQTYGRTHMWYGAQLLIMLVVALAGGLEVGVVQMLATIIAILALLVAPFWFNPFTFDWQKNKVGGPSTSFAQAVTAVSMARPLLS